MPARFVDLSHVITDGMQTYPGLPVPVIGDHLTREAAELVYGPGVTFHIGTIAMCANTGTYIDMPSHRFADGHDLTGLALERVARVPALCVDVRGLRSIPPDVLAGLDLAGRAVLFHTGHSRHFGRPAYFEGHPYLDQRTAQLLVGHGVACAGVDSLNIDATDGPAGAGRPVHTTLLGAGIPIIEHLAGLDALPADGFWFTAVPPKVAGLGTFTVRAFAEIA